MHIKYVYLWLESERSVTHYIGILIYYTIDCIQVTDYRFDYAWLLYSVDSEKLAQSKNNWYYHQHEIEIDKSLDVRSWILYITPYGKLFGKLLENFYSTVVLIEKIRVDDCLYENRL